MYVAQGLLSASQCRWRSHSGDHPGTNTQAHLTSHTLTPLLLHAPVLAACAARGPELKTLINIISIIIEI